MDMVIDTDSDTVTVLDTVTITAKDPPILNPKLRLLPMPTLLPMPNPITVTDMPDTDMVFPDIALFLSVLLLYITIMAKDPPMLSPITADTDSVTDTVTDTDTAMVITTAKDPQKPNPITDMVVVLITLDMLRLMSDVPFGDLENKM